MVQFGMLVGGTVLVWVLLCPRDALDEFKAIFDRSLIRKGVKSAIHNGTHFSIRSLLVLTTLVAGYAAFLRVESSAVEHAIVLVLIAVSLSWIVFISLRGLAGRGVLHVQRETVFVDEGNQGQQPLPQVRVDKDNLRHNDARFRGQSLPKIDVSD